MSDISHHKARVGALSRSRRDDDAELQDAKRKLHEAKIAACIQANLDKAPPLTDDQRNRLAELLRPVRIGGAA